MTTETFIAWSPTVYDGEAFWVEASIDEYLSNTSSIRRLPLSANGQVMTVVEAFPSAIGHIAVDDGQVVFSAWMENYKGKGADLSYLFRAAKAGGEEATGMTGTEDTQMIGPALFESTFYFFSGPWHETSPMHWRLQRIALSSDGYIDETAPLAEFEPTMSPSSLIADPSNVYWTRGSEGTGESELMRTATKAIGEKDPTPIVTGLGITTLAQDEESLFFVNKANALVRLAK